MGSDSSRLNTNLAVATGFEEVGGEPWDPLGFGKFEDSADTFPNMFPRTQYLQEAEIKHGRMSMLAWTGIWATHAGGLGLGMPYLVCPMSLIGQKHLGRLHKSNQLY